VCFADFAFGFKVAGYSYGDDGFVFKAFRAEEFHHRILSYGSEVSPTAVY